MGKEELKSSTQENLDKIDVHLLKILDIEPQCACLEPDCELCNNAKKLIGEELDKMFKE